MRRLSRRRKILALISGTAAVHISLILIIIWRGHDDVLTNSGWVVESCSLGSDEQSGASVQVVLLERLHAHQLSRAVAQFARPIPDGSAKDIRHRHQKKR